jgi:hypothetical protein
MHRIDTVNVASELPTPDSVGTTVGYFQKADPLSDQEPTKLSADWFNDVQENLSHVIEDPDGGNTALAKGNYTQLKEAILAMIEANANTASVFPKGYLQGTPFQYVSASSVKIPAGFHCRDGADTRDISFAADAVVSLAANGVNGLDTGAEANSTFYYLWSIDDSTGTHAPAGLFSLSATNPNLPTGYDKKRRIGVVCNDASGNLIPSFVSHLGLDGLSIQYKGIVIDNFISGGPTNVLINGSATTYTTVSCSAFIPPICKYGLFLFAGWTSGNGTARTFFRTLGNSVDEMSFLTTASGTSDTISDQVLMPMEVDASQRLEYKNSLSNARASITVMGFKLPHL